MLLIANRNIYDIFGQLESREQQVSMEAMVS